MLREFFYFSKSDRKVIVFLVIMVAVSISLIYGLGDVVLTADKGDVVPDTRTFRRTERPRGEHRDYVYDTGEGTRPELFTFDPNTADSTQLLRLGLQPWQVRNIYKYRAKGGVYRKPTDFARLYGLTVDQYRRLEPYIRIRGDYRQAADVIAEDPRTFDRDTLRYPRKIAPGDHVMLNRADTTQLKKVPGIGSYYAKAIVNYRNRLGGFASVDQLLEIEGFPRTAIEYFVVSHDDAVRKIDVNRLSLNELKRHPYISFFQARAITDYRRLRGSLHSIADLSLLKEFTPKDIARLTPYVKF